LGNVCYAPKLVVRLASSCAVEPNDSYDVVWDFSAIPESHVERLV